MNVGSGTLREQAGLTYRQVDHWTRTGILRPLGEGTPGSGRTRLFTSKELDVAVTLAALAPCFDSRNGPNMGVVAEMLRSARRDEVVILDDIHHPRTVRRGSRAHQDATLVLQPRRR